jgi:hypothetical protein
MTLPDPDLVRPLAGKEIGLPPEFDDGHQAILSTALTSVFRGSPRGPVKFDDYGNLTFTVYIRRVRAPLWMAITQRQRCREQRPS